MFNFVILIAMSEFNNNLKLKYMQLTWTKEEEYVLHQLKQDLIQIKQQFITALITFSVWSGRVLLNQLLSYSEFSYTNIREKGLKNVLIERALRFFKIEDRVEAGGGILRKRFKRKKQIRSNSGHNYYSVNRDSSKIKSSKKKGQSKLILSILLTVFVRAIRLLLKRSMKLLSLK